MTDPKLLDAVFGEGAAGVTAEERATNSRVRYVRSQWQLARWNERATGRVLNAREALDAFGMNALREVALDGRSLIAHGDEPAATIARRRADIGLSAPILAELAQVSEAEVSSAETPGETTSIHALQRISETLSLDDRALGLRGGADADPSLGRLRELNPGAGIDERRAGLLSEAAWVIRRQVELLSLLGRSSAAHAVADFGRRSADYRFRASDRGYELADRTRRLLGLDETAPILSVRKLAETSVGLPVIECDLGQAIAGATISNGGNRGIVVSSFLASTGRSLLRRMTLAHELGHALWDPDGQLLPVQVDGIGSVRGGTPGTSVEEMRANAFAVALLAPAKALRGVLERSASPSQALLEVVRTHGISPQAARFHLHNACGVPLEAIELPRTSEAAKRAWHSAEDVVARSARSLLLPIPTARAGVFAELVLEAADRNLVSSDTAAAWLRVPRRLLEDATSPQIAEG